MDNTNERAVRLYNARRRRRRTALFNSNRSRQSRFTADRLNTRCDWPRPARGRVPLNIHRPVDYHAAVKYGKLDREVNVGELCMARCNR